jgi:hypothetical protein
MKALLLFAIGLLALAQPTFCQSAPPSFGPSLSLSDGQCAEVIPADTLRRIGRHAYSTVTGRAYRFSVQGQELDDEVVGIELTRISFGFSNPDIRVGRFFSIDPLATTYPWNSPYAFAENSVIRYRDLEGLERGDFPSFWGATSLILAIDTEAESAGRIQRQWSIVQRTPSPPKPVLQYNPGTIGVPDQDKVRNNAAVDVAESLGLADLIRLGWGRDHTGQVSNNVRAGSGFSLFGGPVAGYLLKKTFQSFRALRTLSRQSDRLQPNGRMFDFDVNNGIKFKDNNLGAGRYDYVITESGELRIGNGHDFLAGNGQDALKAAGEININEKGLIDMVNNNSGHYTPSAEDAMNAAGLLKDLGLTSSDVHVVDVTK